MTWEDSLESSRRDLIVIIPVYNEEGSIEKVINTWTTHLKRIGMNFEIDAYNDGSVDKTQEILDNLKKNISCLSVHSKSNSGHGPTILKGYQENCSRAEWILQIDSDDEMGAEHFENLWHLRDRYQFILGQRRGRESLPLRRFVSFCSRIVVHSFYGTGIHDVNSPYRLMKTACFQPCFFSIPKLTFAPNLIVSGYAALKKLNCCEIAVPHRNRFTGTGSLRNIKLFKGIIKSFIQTVCYRFFHYPG
ncbi:MAG: glycosyltransferase family 2 protein [bacterium]